MNEIAKFGFVTIHGYGLMIAVGVLCAIVLASVRAKRKGLDPDIVLSLGLLSLIFGMIGAKLLYCIVEYKALISSPMQIFTGTGFVVFGGIIGGTAAAFFYCRRKKVNFLLYLDLMMPSVALAQGFGRIGCFLAGCCYGRETDSFVGFVYHDSTCAPNGIPLIPTQLFSSTACFLLAAVLLLYARKPRIDGRIGALYIMLYSVGRFIIEFFRDDFRGSIGVLSTSQVLSLLFLLIGIALYFRRKIPGTRFPRD